MTPIKDFLELSTEEKVVFILIVVAGSAFVRLVVGCVLEVI